MFYTVYKTTNKLNGKIYVGIHKTNDLDDDYLGSGLHLGRAIEKYGIENFEKEILAVFDKASDMFEMESEIVNEDFLEREDTYNLKLGGEGGWDWINRNLSDEQKLKRAVNGAKAANNNGANIKGSKRHQELLNDENYKENWRKKLSKSSQKFYKNGGKNGMSGKKHSEEWKKEQSRAQSGVGNSQFGKMWIHNLEIKESKVILKTDIIPEGWIKGRKMKFNNN